MTALDPYAAASAQQPGSSPSESAFLELVEQRLQTFIDRHCRVLLDVSPDLEPVVATVRDLAPGGKRLRAAFCHWGWLGADPIASDAAVDGAVALELFHLAALVHDDVMDHSDTRRGSMTAHERFSRDHRRGHLDGDPQDFGTGAALLIGDLCMTWSDELLSGISLDPASRTATRSVYDLMRSQVMAGQYLDMLEQARPGMRRNAAELVLRFKSAKYTVEHPLQLGGAMAGASAEVLAAYSRFGIPVGEAFQLRDDLLGAFGDPTRTGKPVGDDLREGKKTPLVLTAFDRADAAQRQLLHRLGDRGMTDVQVSELQRVLVDTGAVADIERRIVDLTDRGVREMHAADVPTPVARGLAELALRIAGRTA